MYLLALAPGGRPADHFLMTKWNITAQDNIWVVNPSCSHSPACTQRRSHALLQRVASRVLPPSLHQSMLERPSHKTPHTFWLQSATASIVARLLPRPRRELSLRRGKGGCWPARTTHLLNDDGDADADVFFFFLFCFGSSLPRWQLYLMRMRRTELTSWPFHPVTAHPPQVSTGKLKTPPKNETKKS